MSSTFSITRYAVGYVRTLDHLKAWQLVLPTSVRRITVSLGLSGERHAGTRLFLQQNIPQLKYHNPSVEFTAEGHHDDTSEIKVVSEDGSCQFVETTGLRWQDIQKKLSTLFPDSSPPLPSPPPSSQAHHS